MKKHTAILLFALMFGLPALALAEDAPVSEMTYIVDSSKARI